MPDSLTLSSLVGVFPTGTASPFASFSAASFNAANTPYSSGRIGMTVSFAAAPAAGVAASPAAVASSADGSNTTGYDNTPATVTLAATGNALVPASSVPEPAALALLPAGLLALMAARRRRA